MKCSAACLLFSSQGAGLYIRGTATLINSNVYENEAAAIVCSPRWDVTRARFLGLQGGGLVLGGTATLTNTKVYSNKASDVCSPSAPAQTFPPSP
jgi:hypothetical protein